jgi:hypothetical protein
MSSYCQDREVCLRLSSSGLWRLGARQRGTAESELVFWSFGIDVGSPELAEVPTGVGLLNGIFAAIKKVRKKANPATMYVFLNIIFLPRQDNEGPKHNNRDHEQRQYFALEKIFSHRNVASSVQHKLRSRIIPSSEMRASLEGRALINYEKFGAGFRRPHPRSATTLPAGSRPSATTMT